MERQGMDAVLAKLSRKLGRKPMLKRKGLTNSDAPKMPGMTVVIGMGKPMKDRGAMAKRDDNGYPTDEEGQDDEPIKETSLEGLSAKIDALMERMVTETSPEGLSAKIDALMERIDALEERMGDHDYSDGPSEDEEDNNMDEEEED